MKSASVAGLVLALLPVARALAAPDVWVATSPPGGTVTALAVSPDVPGLSYVAIEGGRLFRSTDGGQSYVLLSSPSPGTEIGALSFDRSDPSRLYVGAGNVVHVTSDGASSYGEVVELFDSITVIAPDPSLDDRLYVATENGGVFKSDDHGASFTNLDSLNPFDPVVRALAVDPDDSSRLYIGTSFSLLYSDDAGGTVDFSDPSPAGATAIVVDPTNPSRIYATGELSFEGGVFVSDDGGVSWSATGLSDVWPTAVVLDPADPTRLYAGTYGAGVFKSNDGGTLWASASVELPEPRVAALAVASDGSLLLGGAYGGTFVSTDDAASWQRGGSDFAGSWVEALATSDSRILASAKGNGVFASTNGGASWAFAGDGLPMRDVMSLAVDPSNEDIVYAGTDGAGVFKSSDGLTSFAAIAPTLANEAVTALAIAPSDSSFVVAGLRSEVGGTSVFISHDGGTGFAGSATDVPGWVTAIVFSDGDLFVATEGQGLWKSEDDGVTFVPKNFGAGDYGQFLLSFAAHPVTGILYEGQHGGGLGVSLDGGEAWSVFDQGLPGFWLSGLAAHPTHAGELFVATYFDGVARTFDDGLSFQAYSAGLTNTNLAALALTPDATTLIAGTRGGGAYVVHPSPLPSTGEGGGGAGEGGGGASGGAGEGGSVSANGGGGNGEPLGGGGDPERPADEGCTCTAAAASEGAPTSILLAALAAIGRLRRRPRDPSSRGRLVNL